jgi:hypothetical protein
VRTQEIRQGFFFLLLLLFLWQKNFLARSWILKEKNYIFFLFTKNRITPKHTGQSLALRCSTYYFFSEWNSQVPVFPTVQSGAEHIVVTQ